MPRPPERLTAFIASLQLLSIIPLQSSRAPTSIDLGRTVIFFPIVGAALWTMAVAAALGFYSLLPSTLSAILGIGVLVVSTGALHFDGLMDSADGLFGGRVPARRLEIMRDSRVGTYGVLAAVLLLFAQVAALDSLIRSSAGWLPLLAISLAVGSSSRLAMVWSLWRFPSAQPDGLGAALHGAVSSRFVIVAVVVGIAIAAPSGGVFTIASIGVAFILSEVIGRYAVNRLGGLTGDIYGATGVLVESAALIVAAAVVGAP
ncbi:MAG TPA: adenosylcobinamide-GDP ribazoletransferase [Chloroflexota bacterium]|nr:adenosylcobinamide-GDP ribazoletransferase [Chloroflexota bacterium]